MNDKSQVFRLSHWWDEFSSFARRHKVADFFATVNQLRADITGEPVVGITRDGWDVYFPSEHGGG